jgi:NAD(P)H-dependent FMN reductase
MSDVEVLLVSGSLQAHSANRALLRVAQRCAPPGVRLVRAPELGEVAHFNPDLDETPGVTQWRAAVGRADAVLVASPEYAHSLPGSLKNALDWLVGTGELYEKPVAVMSAGTSGGAYALDAIERTLGAQGARVTGRLSVAGVRPKLDASGDIADPATVEQACALLGELVTAARARAADRAKS